MSELDEETARIKQNKKALKNLQKFMKTGKMYDDNGNELDLASTVSFEMPHNGSFEIPTVDQLRSRIDKLVKESQ